MCQSIKIGEFGYQIILRVLKFIQINSHHFFFHFPFYNEMG